MQGGDDQIIGFEYLIAGSFKDGDRATEEHNYDTCTVVRDLALINF